MQTKWPPSTLGSNPSSFITVSLFILAHHCEDWEDIATLLSFENILITDIKKNHSNDRREQRKEFLKEARCRGLTYFDILRSLCEIKRGGKAKDVIDDLGEMSVYFSVCIFDDIMQLHIGIASRLFFFVVDGKVRSMLVLYEPEY